jgi:hypothetical protein
MSFWVEAVVFGVGLFTGMACVEGGHLGYACVAWTLAAFVVGHMLGHWEALCAEK